MRRGTRLERATVAAACGALLGMVLQGCACTEDVSVVNSTPTDLHVQFAYPWPSYAIATDSGCQFEFWLAPGETWRSKDARRADATDLPIAQANGLALVRVRGGQAVWRLFGVVDDARFESLAPIEFAISETEGRFDVAATSREGHAVTLEELDDAFWFRVR